MCKVNLSTGRDMPPGSAPESAFITQTVGDDEHAPVGVDKRTLEGCDSAWICGIERSRNLGNNAAPGS